MSDYQVNRQFADKHMPLVQDILRQNAMYIVSIDIASDYEDMKYSTDLKIIITGGSVAVRVRRHGYSFRDLTIRAYNHGCKTEIHKLREGYADWYLYAWEDDRGGFDDWILVDINKMRDCGMLSVDKKVTMNKDGSSGFISYSIIELIENNVLVARKEFVEIPF